MRFRPRTWLLLGVLLFSAAYWVWTFAEKMSDSRHAQFSNPKPMAQVSIPQPVDHSSNSKPMVEFFSATSPPVGVRLTGLASWNGGGQAWPFEIVMEGFDRYYRKEWFPQPTNLLEHSKTAPREG
jgi:hypothetical protein